MAASDRADHQRKVARPLLASCLRFLTGLNEQNDKIGATKKKNHRRLTGDEAEAIFLSTCQQWPQEIPVIAADGQRRHQNFYFFHRSAQMWPPKISGWRTKNQKS